MRPERSLGHRRLIGWERDFLFRSSQCVQRAICRGWLSGGGGGLKYWQNYPGGGRQNGHGDRGHFGRFQVNVLVIFLAQIVEQFIQADALSRKIEVHVVAPRRCQRPLAILVGGDDKCVLQLRHTDLQRAFNFFLRVYNITGRFFESLCLDFYGTGGLWFWANLIEVAFWDE